MSVSSRAVDRSVLTAVHPERYVASIERTRAAGGGLLDADTVVSERSFEAALHAAGGAVRMVELLLDGEASAAFSSHRPPGHHALPSQAMGFCLFNHVAVAARYAKTAARRAGDDRRLRRAPRIAPTGLPREHRVLYVSTHQSPLYPGTGAAETGAGEGAGSPSTCRCRPAADEVAYRPSSRS